MAGWRRRQSEAACAERSGGGGHGHAACGLLLSVCWTIGAVWVWEFFFFSIFFSFCRWKPTLVSIWVLVWRRTGELGAQFFLIIFLCVGKYRQEKQVTDRKIGNFSVCNRNTDRKIKLPTENFNYPVGRQYFCRFWVPDRIVRIFPVGGGITDREI
jgi:hypothetical protein